MAGIDSYGAALPSLRLPAEAYARAWGQCQARGLEQKAFCAYDEDAVTLAIAAAQVALARLAEAPVIDALFFGCTTPPYEEKPSAATIATACLARTELRVVEIGGSPQAGLQAVIAAAEFCDAHPGARALAVAADAPAAPPDAPYEHAFGAAAAAFVIGSGDGIARLDGTAAVTRETFGARFRRHGADTISDLELRTRDNDASLAALGGILDGAGARHLAMAADAGLMRGAPRALGCAEAKPDALWARIGDAAAAAAPLALCAALDEAAPGETILAVALGAGAIAARLTAGAGLAALRGSGARVADLVSGGRVVDYLAYLKHRRVLSSRFGGAG